MSGEVRYRVTGMDCPKCAARIEKAARSAGIERMTISTATQVLSLDPVDEAMLRAMEAAISAAGYRLDRMEAASPAPGAHLTAGYRRALWIVVALNLGYGIVETVGGFLAGSQALKADALDFLGDGLITLLGIVAIGWAAIWRARSAMAQGIFLGVLGLGVVAGTARRIFAEAPIEPHLMGALAAAALAVNIAAALVLVPHRNGDSNMRAVWLFSRNDALGNLATVVAAVLVGATGRIWPDLVVAFAIAGLFLQSAWVIVRDAGREMHRPRGV